MIAFLDADWLTLNGASLSCSMLIGGKYTIHRYLAACSLADRQVTWLSYSMLIGLPEDPDLISTMIG